MSSEKEKMMAGQLYHASDKPLATEHLGAEILTFEYNRTSPDETARRNAIISPCW